MWWSISAWVAQEFGGNDLGMTPPPLHLPSAPPGICPLQQDGLMSLHSFLPPPCPLPPLTPPLPPQIARHSLVSLRRGNIKNQAETITSVRSSVALAKDIRKLDAASELLKFEVRGDGGSGGGAGRGGGGAGS